MTDAKKELAEFAMNAAVALDPQTPHPRRELADHLVNVANLIGRIEQGFETLAKCEMNQGDWKMFALALLDFAEGPDARAMCLFEDAGEVDGMTEEGFMEKRYETLDQIRADLMSIS